jgi:hypothetical protein
LLLYGARANRRAVLLARQNAEKNHTPNIEIRQGNLYASVRGPLLQHRPFEPASSAREAAMSADGAKRMTSKNAVLA